MPSTPLRMNKLAACQGCGAEVSNDGGLIGGGKIRAAGHAANEMWPLFPVVFRDPGQSVAFEAMRDEKSPSILQLLGIDVIGASI